MRSGAERAGDDGVLVVEACSCRVFAHTHMPTDWQRLQTHAAGAGQRRRR
jgi:hypothetical protein